MRRREFLTMTAGAAAGMLVGRDAWAASPVVADLELALRAAPARVALLDGPPTEVWRFSAHLVHGSAGALVAGGDCYLGPALRVRTGQRVRVHLDNAIGEPTIVHWHGLYVSERNDGHPSSTVRTGARYDYDFEVGNRAGLYWYHPHPDRRTGPQVYRGLAGLVVVSDDEEKRLGLPDSDRELTLVLQDRTFDGDNQLVYAPDPTVGLLGDRVLINGRVPRPLDVPRGPHRIRILNGSNSRVYDLAWSDGSPLTVLGTDGGLLDAPLERSHVVLAPAQRLDLWASFGDRPGDDVWLESRAFSSLGPAMVMGRGMTGGQAARVPNGAPLRFQRFTTTRRGTPGAPPPRLTRAPGPDRSRAVNANHPRTFSTTMAMMQWRLNGRAFELRGVADNERVRLGTVEDWELINPDGPMAMAHPIRLHGRQFRVVERQHGPGLATLRDGLLDDGWIHTVLLLPGDRVRIRVAFDRHAGMFLYHCHNLEHEDMGMMRNDVVEAT
ncbi:MAG: multicopper oxidase family protein [Kofleriaceae bacterium]